MEKRAEQSGSTKETSLVSRQRTNLPPGPASPGSLMRFRTAASAGPGPEQEWTLVAGPSPETNANDQQRVS